MKLYDKVKNLLQEHPELRDSDKKLLIEVWKGQGIINNGYMNEALFLRSAISAESITRARRKIQEGHMHLRSCEEVEQERKVREENYSMSTWGVDANFSKYSN